MLPLRRMGREIRHILRASTDAHQHLRDRVSAILVASIAVDLVCGVLALAFERHAQGTQIHSFGTAIFWSTTQLLTVSSQMPNPLTTAGRVLDVFMEAYAISVVATLAGATGAFFHRRSDALSAESGNP